MVLFDYSHSAVIAVSVAISVGSSSGVKMSEWEYLKFTEEDMRHILQVYNRTPETVKQDVDAIQEWICSQPHLPCILDDNRILKFLFMAKCSVEKTKNKIDNYLSLRTTNPEFFDKIDPSLPNMQVAIKYCILVPMPKLTKELNRVVIFKVPETINDEVDPIDCFGFAMLLAEVRLLYDCMLSDITIIDLKHINVAHLSKFNPMQVKSMINVVERAFCMRSQRIILLHAPTIIDKILVVVKSFLKPKIAARIQLAKNVEELYEYMPKEILPKEYGGDEESIEVISEKWKDKMLELTPWLNTLKENKVNEKLRQGKPLNDEYLGFHGNFRKLELD